MKFTTGDTPQHESYQYDGAAELPKGWLLWHSYSNYKAQDSRLLLQMPDGTMEEIKGDFINAMNGNFGKTPEQITFMAFDRIADEWNIFLYDKGNITNLTKYSGYHNEDPKWSPDGKQIVFKRTHRNRDGEALFYSLALLDVKTKAVTILTNDDAEEAMPCFSSDGTKIYFAKYSGKIGSIFCLDLITKMTQTIFSEPDVNAYYPIVSDTFLYFTKWRNSKNTCDQIVCFDGNKFIELPFNSEKFDCSDVCPVNQDSIIYSCHKNGVYDLYFYNGTFSASIKKLNTDKNELGADFYLLK